MLVDGTQWIVFESHHESHPDCCGELWKVRIDGTGLVRSTTGADDRQPEWSAKVEQIAFQRQVSLGNWDVFTVDVDGGSLFNVTNNPTLSNTDCSWSPSGNFIVYSAGGADINIANLFAIPATGTALRSGSRTAADWTGRRAGRPMAPRSLLNLLHTMPTCGEARKSG